MGKGQQQAGGRVQCMLWLSSPTLKHIYIPTILGIFKCMLSQACMLGFVQSAGLLRTGSYDGDGNERVPRD